ncbi:LysR family transcriptional regulator [Sphingosinithalassobacter tenebrarum]|uniref:LysR family transcriptional regulator n=2 Tax=Stakelama tenebrarum TaxID=2711215 RepID=A0A6G6Y9U5_9SPHN|nr:LysR family transcriptional regulator [Sphingosinithalassobacter tenebrarum]
MQQADLPEDWERQRAFLAVLREGSLSAAARALGLAQPTVRRRIEEIEARTGAVLFARSPSGLEPTETALALRDHAEAMERSAESFLRAASVPPGEISGTVRIAADTVMASDVLPALLAPLLRAHERLRVAILSSGPDGGAVQRETDIAIWLDKPEQPMLVTRRIGSLAFGLFAHASYLEARSRPKSLAALDGHVVIGTLPDARPGDSDDAPPLPREHQRLLCDSRSAQLGAIRAGLGIGLCPLPLARRDPNLIRLLADAVAFQHDVWLAYHEDLRPLARVRAVHDALADGLSDYLGKPLQRLAPRSWPGAD